MMLAVLVKFNNARGNCFNSSQHSHYLNETSKIYSNFPQHMHDSALIQNRTLYPTLNFYFPMKFHCQVLIIVTWNVLSLYFFCEVYTASEDEFHMILQYMLILLLSEFARERY